MAAAPRTVLTGATGTLGRELRPLLRERGHDLRLTSRDPPPDDPGDWVRLDLADGTGVEAAVENRDVVVHCASDAFGDSEAVDIEGTRDLLRAAEAAGVSNFVYISIVGIDAVPYSYYRAKRRAETAVIESDVPATILRSTQFYSLLEEIFGRLRYLPVWPLPQGVELQPIPAATVATRLAAGASPEAQGRLDPIGGPEIISIGDLARTYRTVRGPWRPIIEVPYPGDVFAALQSGALLCPDNPVDTTTRQEWLDA